MGELFGGSGDEDFRGLHTTNVSYLGHSGNDLKESKGKKKQIPHFVRDDSVGGDGFDSVGGEGYRSGRLETVQERGKS